MLGIKRSIFDVSSAISITIIEQGRILATTFCTIYGRIDIIGMHFLAYAWPVAKKQELLRTCVAFIPRPEDSLGLIAGDFDCSSTGDFRLTGKSSTMVLAADATTKLLEDILCNYIELSQDNFNWTRSNAYSRLDRVYCNLRSSD
jgi:hypothetical protein